MKDKWNSYETQRSKQIAKDESYIPFGGMSFRHVPFWTRIKLALLMLIGIEIENLHVDIKNSGVKEAERFVEEASKDEAFVRAVQIAAEEFKEED